MRTKECLTRCLYIVRKLRRDKQLTFAEIQSYLKSLSWIIAENDIACSIRTFQRDMETIEDLFSIQIRYSRKNRKYYIDKSNNDHLLGSRLVESLEIFHSFQMVDSLKEVFYVGQQRPLGTEHLSPLIEAIKETRIVEIHYRPNFANASELRQIVPLLLREYRGRWYVVSQRTDNQQYRTYALDRIDQIDPTDKIGNRPDNLNDHYQHCYGIFSSSDWEPKEIILSFTPRTGRFVKDLPIHPSQELLIDNDEEVRIRLYLFIAQDFKMELLSHGAQVKVIAPAELRSQIAQIARQTAAQYE